MSPASKGGCLPEVLSNSGEKWLYRGLLPELPLPFGRVSYLSCYYYLLSPANNSYCRRTLAQFSCDNVTLWAEIIFLLPSILLLFRPKNVQLFLIPQTTSHTRRGPRQVWQASPAVAGGIPVMDRRRYPPRVKWHATPFLTRAPSPHRPPVTPDRSQRRC